MKGTWKLARAAVLAAGIACAGGVRAQTEALPAPPPGDEPATDPRVGSVRPPSEPPPEALPVAPPAPPPQTSSDPCLSIVALSIDKSERQLSATCASGLVKTFRVALGQLPLGYKRETKDLRTPEGFYRIAEPPRGSRFHVFMLLDYPSLSDADRALSNGDISPQTYLRIARAVARGEVPPQDTLLGGLIGIHGEGRDHQGDSKTQDWTFGCIALSDEDAEYIAFRVDVGTPVKIEP